MQQENDHVLLSFHSSPKKGDNWFDLSFGVIFAWLKLIQNQNWTKLFASFLKRCFISFGVSLKYFLYTSEILILKTSKWPIFVNWWIHFTKISHLSVKTYIACNISIFFFSFRRLSFIIFLNFSNCFWFEYKIIGCWQKIQYSSNHANNTWQQQEKKNRTRNINFVMNCMP